MPKTYPVYIVDDNRAMREFLAILCEGQGLDCRCFENGEDFLAALDTLEPGCVLLDMHMPKRSGLEVQAEIARGQSRMPVVAITGHGDVEMAVESMKLGALDFLEKPFEDNVIFGAIDRGFAQLEETSA